MSSPTSTNAPADGPRWLAGADEPSAKRPPLSRRRIVEAAVSLIDEVGLSGLTIRRIAGELGVSPMAIYSHVADKAQLIDLFVDHVVGEAHVDPDPDLGWIDQLRVIFIAYRESWSRHPGVIQAYAAAAASPNAANIGPNAMAQGEQVLGVFAAAGFEPRDQARAFMVLHSFLRGSLTGQPNRMQSLEAADAPDRNGGLDSFLNAIDPATVPHFVAAAPYLVSVDNFEFALDVVLAGLAVQLNAKG